MRLPAELAIPRGESQGMCQIHSIHVDVIGEIIHKHALRLMGGLQAILSLLLPPSLVLDSFIAA